MDVQNILRFLTANAKLPLATAMPKIKDLKAADIKTVEDIATSNITTLQTIFTDDKIAKSVLNAAKRVGKKRDATSDTTSPAKKRVRLAPGEVLSPADLEDSLALPAAVREEDVLSETVLVTNRAPLVLAFAVTLLKYTMPDQPMSSRLSLAQAVVSVNSRSKAVSIGLESGKSAEEEGYGDGQPIIRIMGRNIRAMRRWGYDPTSKGNGTDAQTTNSTTTLVGDVEVKEDTKEGIIAEEKETPLFGLDLEALRKIAVEKGIAPRTNLPIHTPQSARSYLLRSFEVAKPAADKTGPKKVAAVTAAQKEKSLGLLLGALELLFESWSQTLDVAELDGRTWGWYISVRPDVLHGVDGWGGRGEVSLTNILKLRRKPQ